MKALKNLRVVGAWGLFFLVATFGPGLAEGQVTPNRVAPNEIEWRTWTHPAGEQIQAYIQDVRRGQVVIVRRDGRVFSAPMERFSKADQLYIVDWARTHLPNANFFRSLDLSQFEVPEEHHMEGVERQEPGAGEPLEPAAVQMVLDFHGIPYDETLAERISVREIIEGRFIPPEDLLSTLETLPVEAEVLASWDPYAPRHEEYWDFALRAIKVAISMDLPVIVGYRPLMEIDTPELVGVAVGYDEDDIEIIEPAGSDDPERYHVDDFEFMFAYAMILFPTFEPQLPALDDVRIEADFLNLVSDTIGQSLGYDAFILTDLLRQKGLEAIVQNVNRTDIQDQLGRTRSFAREGGLPILDAALNNGRVVIVPQEYENGSGFALIYGRADEAYATVQFFPNRTFKRGFTPRSDLALRWMTRVDGAYRLDLVQIPVPISEIEPLRPSRRPPPPPVGEPSPPPLRPRY